MSVLEILAPNDIHSGKLGVVDLEKACDTCDCFMEECPGHFGHLELPLATYKVFWNKRTISILNCICFYCQRARLPKSDPYYRFVLGLQPEHRLGYVEQYARDYKHCPTSSHLETEHSSVYKHGCGKPYISWSLENREGVFLTPTIPLDTGDIARYEVHGLKTSFFTISPEDVYECLRHLSVSTKQLLGLTVHCEPWALMWKAVPIPSHNTRPCHMFSGVGTDRKKGNNDWTKMLELIIKARNDLANAMRLYPSERINIAWYSLQGIVSHDPLVCLKWHNVDKSSKDAFKESCKKSNNNNNVPNSNNESKTVEQCWRTLTKYITAFHSCKHQKYFKLSYGKPLMGVEERFKGSKSSRLRGNVVSRRQGNATRNVLEGDMRLDPRYAGLPIHRLMELTFPEPVNARNVVRLHQAILNGPYTYPGANYIILNDGTEVDLSYYSGNRRALKMSDIHIVRRHVIKDDVILMNRQPTLHRLSQMGMLVQPIPGFVTRMHHCVYKCYGGDNDGDEVTSYVLQTYESRAEALELCGIEKNILKDGRVWINFIHNAVAGAWLLTNSRRYSREEAIGLLQELDYVYDIGEASGYNAEAEPYWTGHQIVSHLFPSSFSMKWKDVEICNGKLLKGQLNEEALNGFGGILEHMFRDMGGSATIGFLKYGYLLFSQATAQYGMTIGYYHVAWDKHDENLQSPSHQTILLRRKQIQEEMIPQLNQYVNQYPDHRPRGQEDLETNIKQHIEYVTMAYQGVVSDYHQLKNKTRQDNGLLLSIQSGAKGNMTALNSIDGIVGQIVLGLQRLDFDHDQPSLENQGFIPYNYATGVPLRGVMAESHAACESVLNKNRGTSKSGYIVRKLSTCMMGVVVDREGRAVDTSGRVLWNVYGDDGYDPQLLTNVNLPKNPLSLEPHYHSEYQSQALELETISFAAKIRIPFDFEHLFYRCQMTPTVSNVIPVSAHSITWFCVALWNKLILHRLVVGSHRGFQMLFWHWFHPSVFVTKYQFHSHHAEWLGNEIRDYCVSALINPGESVGESSTQSMGEPYVQMSLKTPHLSGKFHKSSVDTVRIAEIVDSKYHNPTMHVALKRSKISDVHQATLFGLSLCQCVLMDVCDDVYYQEPWFCFLLNRFKTIYRGLQPRLLAMSLCEKMGLPLTRIQASFTDESMGEHWTIRIHLIPSDNFWKMCLALDHEKLFGGLVLRTESNQGLNLHIQSILYNMAKGFIVHGIPSVETFIVESDSSAPPNPNNPPHTKYSLTTLGSALSSVLSLPEVDAKRTTSNDCREMYEVLGNEAGRKSLEYEFLHVIGGSTDERHIKLIARKMVSELSLKGMKINQVGQSIPPLMRAYYESGPKQMTEYCANGERDHASTMCGAAMTNARMKVGTGYCLSLMRFDAASDRLVEINRDDPIGTRRSMDLPLMCDYVASPKIDGTRCFLLINGPQMYLINRMNQVVKGNMWNSNIPANGPQAPSLLDGDLLWHEGRLCYIIYDCAMSYGNVCASLRYDQRLEIAREVLWRCFQSITPSHSLPVHLFASQGLPIALRPKTSTHLLNVGGIWCSVKPVFRLNVIPQIPWAEYGFPTDGFVFTSLSQPIAPFRTNRTSVLKWKPVEYHTIDVIMTVHWEGLGWALLDKTWDGFRKTFGKCALLGLMGKDLQIFSFVDLEIGNDDCYEVQWSNQTWKPIRKRDKAANTFETIVATCRSILDGLTLGDICLNKK